MAIPVSRRKRQSRLNFTPAPSSSPVRPEAFVRIDDGSSPAKKRKVNQATPLKQATNNVVSSPVSRKLERVQIPSITKKFHLPTPVPSSERQRDVTLDSDDNSDNIIVTNSRRSHRAAHNIASESNTIANASSDNEGNLDAVYLSSETEVGSNAREAAEETEDAASSSRPKSVRASSFIKGGIRGGGRKGSWKKKPAKPQGPRWQYESVLSESENADDLPLPSSSRPNVRASASRRQLRSRTNNGDSSSSLSEKYRSSPSNNRKSALAWDFSGSEDSDDKVVKKGRRRLFRGHNANTEQTANTDDIKEATMISSNDEPEPETSEAESDIIVTPSRPRRHKTNETESPKGKKRQGESDLEDEVADLNDSDLELKKRRTRGGPRASQRDIRRNKLAELNASRLRGGDGSPVEDNESSSSDEAVEEPFEVYDKVRERRSTAQDEHAGNPDEYESDFVDDEGADDTVGMDLARGGVPLALTSYGRLKPFEYFKHEVEWMIHNKLNPAFSRHDEIYELSHRKLDDELQGQAGSKFKSSVWKPDFIKALEGRPECHMLPIPAMMEEKCAACNRSGHPPTFKMTFSGTAYDKKSLDPISKDDDSDSDIESLTEDEDAEEENFFVGRHCGQNADIAHTLYHWRYQLNDFILNWLAEEGHLTPQKIVERERWSNKKKEKLANRIHDGMAEGRQMNELYRQFKASLDTARDFKPERYVRRH